MEDGMKSQRSTENGLELRIEAQCMMLCSGK